MFSIHVYQYFVYTPTFMHLYTECTQNVYFFFFFNSPLCELADNC